MTARLTVLGTGGTIVGIAGSATASEYHAGQVAIETYLEQAASLELEATLTGRQIANIDSADMGPQVWNALHPAVMKALNDPDCDGVIVLHGTDTLEETAFLLDCTLPTAKPVVLVGAMRPVDAVGYDGLRNFANAVRVAADPQAAGRGVLVVMGDRAFAARDVRKVRTRGTDAFRGFPRGSVGLVTPSSLEWFGAPWRVDETARFAWHDDLPEVVVLPIHAGITPTEALRPIGPDTRGVVIAGVGEGNMPQSIRAELARRSAGELRVVRASRADEGLVDRERDDEASGFIAARALDPAKARILLQLIIASGIDDPQRMQAYFDRR